MIGRVTHSHIHSLTLSPNHTFVFLSFTHISTVLSLYNPEHRDEALRTVPPMQGEHTKLLTEHEQRQETNQVETSSTRQQNNK